MGLYRNRPSRTETTVTLPDRAAEAKTQAVQNYITLADQVLAGIRSNGYGSGIAPPSDDDDDDFADAAKRSPSDDGRDGRDDVVELDVDDVELPAGHWHDGRFYPDDALDAAQSEESDHAIAAVRSAFTMPP